MKRLAGVVAGLALIALVTGWLLLDPQTSGRKGRQAQRLASELLGKEQPQRLASADDVLHYVSARPDDVGLVSYTLDRDGRAADPAVRHRESEPAPVASAIKIIHLAAYAAAVGAGRLDPAERVSVGGWEAYLVPGTDGGAHPAALARLGLPIRDGRAADPAATVPLDRLVSAMIEESDDAAADYLRHRLGEPALVAAAARGARPAPAHVPSLNGQLLLAFGHCAARDQSGAHSLWRLVALPAERRWELADQCLNEYAAATGEARDRLAPSVLPGPARQTVWAESTAPVAPDTLAALLSATVSDRYVSPQVSAIARRHLEWQTREHSLNDHVSRLGAKGGSLPGLLSEAAYTVASDGEVRVTVLSLRAIPHRIWASGTPSHAVQQFALRLSDDPAYLQKVRTALH